MAKEPMSEATGCRADIQQVNDMKQWKQAPSAVSLYKQYESKSWWSRNKIEQAIGYWADAKKSMYGI
jgi:hypothetical protein